MSTKHTGDLPPDTEDKLRRMQDIRAQSTALGEEYDALRDELLVNGDVCDAEPEYIVGSDGKKYRVTKVVSSSTVYHYDQLTELTAEQQEMVTERKISGSKLKDAIQREQIPAEVALKLVTFVPKAPYPKFDLIDQ